MKESSRPKEGKTRDPFAGSLKLPTKSRTEPNLNQEPGVIPTPAEGDQALGPSSTPFSKELDLKWIRQDPHRKMPAAQVAALHTIPQHR